MTEPETFEPVTAAEMLPRELDGLRMIYSEMEGAADRLIELGPQEGFADEFAKLSERVRRLYIWAEREEVHARERAWRKATQINLLRGVE